MAAKAWVRFPVSALFFSKISVMNGVWNAVKKEELIGVGFEPTPPKRPVPETGALDRSAIQPKCSRAVQL